MQPQPPPSGPPQSHHPYAQQPPRKSGGTSWMVILVIVGVFGVVVLGIFAAIAVPAFTKYMRRAKTSEARVNLAKMFDAASSYYEDNGKCPDHEGPQGRAGVTPSLSVNCNEGAGGRCSATGAGAGGYDRTDWTQNPVWSALGFEVSDGHYFRYDFRWKETDGGCQFTAQAFGDLDDDGVYSTFERAGAADVNGVNGATGLYIDMEVE